MIGCSQRTYQLSMMDNQVVLLSNNQVIRRDCQENDMGRLASKILDQLCETMRELGVNKNKILSRSLFYQNTKIDLRSALHARAKTITSAIAGEIGTAARRLQLILTWAEGNLDHVGGSLMARPYHCTPARLTCVSLPNRWSVRRNF